MSDARWRHIVNGRQPVSAGQSVPAIAPALTLARMAQVVGVTADQLRDVGRPDAADELDRLKTASIPSQRRAGDIPEELMTLARNYSRLADADKEQFLTYLDLINGWAEGRIEQTSMPAARRSRRAG